MTNLADLGRINVHVNNLGVHGKESGLAGDAVIEARTERDEKVGLLKCQHRGNRAVHAGHAEVLLVRVGECPARHERGDHGRAHEFDEFEQLRGGTRANDSATHIEHGLLRLRHEFGRCLNLLAVGLGHRVVARQLIGGWPAEVELLLLSVFGDVDKNRTGTTGRGDFIGRGQGARNIGSLRHQKRMLGDWQGDAHDVGLLERIGSHEVAEHLTGDGQQRNRVHVRIGDGGDQVGRTRTTRGDAHAELARR